MSAIITVFKSDMEDNPVVFATISGMSENITEIANGYAFSPKPGKLYELLNCLKESGVNYQTHFSEISRDE